MTAHIFIDFLGFFFYFFLLFFWILFPNPGGKEGAAEEGAAEEKEGAERACSLFSWSGRAAHLMRSWYR